MLFSVGVFVAVALLLAIVNHISAKLLANYAYPVYLGTGFVGTPVHELGHAVFCVLFGHRITEISFFNPDPDSDCMGYVMHEYNRRNPYHVVGCFFISYGPILFGTAVMVGLLFLMARDTAFAVLDNINSLSDVALSFSDGGVFQEILVVVVNNIYIMFGYDAVTSVGWWFFMFFSMMIAMHMTLSKADVSNSIIGALAFIALMLVACVIAGLIGGSDLDKYNSFMLKAGTYAFSFMSIALILSVVGLGVSMLIFLVRRFIIRR